MLGVLKYESDRYGGAAQDRARFDRLPGELSPVICGTAEQAAGRHVINRAVAQM